MTFVEQNQDKIEKKIKRPVNKKKIKKIKEK